MNLDRDIFLFVCASGHISIGKKGKRDPEFPSALPFHSVDTIEEAKGIQTLHCRLQHDGTYVLNHWAGNVDDIFTLAETLELT